MEFTPSPSLLYFVIVYAIIVAIIGYVWSRKIVTTDDFMLAGRSLGPFILMGTLLATWMGSGTVTGGPNSMAYSHGYWVAVLYATPVLIGIAVLYFLSNRVRLLSKYTIPQILEIKYGPVARVVAVLIIVLAYLGIVSYQFQGVALVLNAATGLDMAAGIWIALILMTFLAMIGGLMSIAPSDALSAFLMVVGLIIAAPVMISIAGGWDNVVANVPAQHFELTGNLDFIGVLGLYFPILFLVMGDQNMWQRMTAAKEEKAGRGGVIGWFIGVAVAMPLVGTIALCSRAMFPEIPPGQALIAATTVMPVFVGGILLAAATAFIFTTGNSFLLSASSNLTYDVYGRIFNKKATSKQNLIFTRLAIPIMALVAFVLIQFFPTILAVQMYSYTVYGAGITPALLGAVLWKGVTKAGGLSSMVAGTVVTIFWETMDKPFDLEAVIISAPVAIVVLIVVSLLTPGTMTTIEEDAGVKSE